MTNLKITRRELAKGVASCSLAIAFTRQAFGATPTRTDHRYQAFHPGAEWLDTNGKPIQAHGGSIISANDWFYWYGENKEFTVDKNSPQSWGIRFYRSKDLYNWEDLGSLIPPDTEDPDSPLSPKGFPERPHILFNPRTREYVCWIKIRRDDPQYRCVLVADQITGPYRMVQRRLLPAGMAAGDFDIVADPDSGKAYMYFEHDHKELVCIELTDDWRATTDRFTTHFQASPPDTTEGIACFRRHEKLYLTASGMTGYFPNPSFVAMADDYLGPFTSLGDLHPDDRSRTSYNSQISCIFRHPRKRDLYIALADRWCPNLAGEDFESGRLSLNLHSGITKAMSKPPQPITPDEAKSLRAMSSVGLIGVNTSISRYVWLPITFEGDRPVIRWQDTWKTEDFA